MVFITCSFAHAEIHKWVDENGVTHYSEFAPSDSESNIEQVEVEKTPEDADKNYEKMKERYAKDKELEDEEKRLEGMDEAQKREYEIMKKNCNLARQNIKVLQNKANRKFKDAKGNVIFYDDKQRAAKVKAAQDYIDNNCTEN